MTSSKTIVGRQGWLAATPPALRQAVLDRSVERRFDTDQMIHVAGDPARGMYGLATGSVRVSMAATDHGPYFVHLLRPGTWFGDSPAILDRPRVATMTAARPTTLRYLPTAAIHEIAGADPSYWRYFMIPLLLQLEDAMGAVVDLMQRDHVKRLIAVVLRLGGCRVAIDLPEGAIEIDASQEDLATMANVARMTAGGILRNLQAEGLLDMRYRRIVLLDPAKLRAKLAA